MPYPKPTIAKSPIKKSYNLHDPADKEAVQSFEKSFLSWLKENPKHKDDIFSLYRWYEKLGAVKIKADDVLGFSITDPKLFFNLERRWDALRILRIMRAEAGKEDEEAFDKINVQEIPF